MRALEKLGHFFPGSRIGIVLVHGLAGTPSEMKQVGKRLNKYGFSVLCPLLAGHCGSEEELVATNWPDWSASVEKACTEMERHMDAVFIGGLSAGAVLTLREAQRNPDGLRGLALYSTYLRGDGWSAPTLSRFMWVLDYVPYLAKRWRSKETYPYGIKNEKLRNRIHAKLQSGDSSEAGHIYTPGLSLREFQRLIRVVKQDMGRVTTPALLLHAENDDISSYRNSQYVQRHINAPSELVLLSDSYHLITIDQERNRVSDETAAFFHSLLTPDEQKELAQHALMPMPTGDSQLNSFIPVPQRRNSPAA